MSDEERRGYAEKAWRAFSEALGLASDEDGE